MTFVSGLEALLLMPFNIHAIIETTWVFGEIFCQVSKQLGKPKREILHGNVANERTNVANKRNCCVSVTFHSNEILKRKTTCIGEMKTKF